MNIQERITERQRRSTEVRDFMRLTQVLAKHAPNASGWRDVHAIEREIANFNSPRLGGWMHGKAAVAGLTAQDSGGASEWADFSDVATEWLITTSARTVLGQLNPIRFPFQVRGIRVSTPDATFVGAGKAIPVSAATVADTTAMQRTAVKCITVCTRELVQVWKPGTLQALDRLLSRSLIRGMDAAFLDPDSTEVAGERPASILNGVAPVALLGTTVPTVLANFKSLFNALTDAGSDLQDCVIAMHPTDAATLSTLITTEGVRAFPNLTVRGGDILGVPVAVTVGAARSGSPSERVIALIDGQGVAVADDNGISLDTSLIASLEMDDAPSGDATAGTGAASVNMYQTESIAIRLVREINWTRLSDSHVAWLTVTA